MKTGKRGIALIKEFEGLKLAAYVCPAGHLTIGYGSTRWPDGRRIKATDRLKNEAEAEALLMATLKPFERDVASLLRGVEVSQNQFDALVSFAFNVGADIDDDRLPEGLGDSTLLRLVKADPENPAIRAEFLKWNKGGGRVLPGLVRRREAEAKLYFEVPRA